MVVDPLSVGDYVVVKGSLELGRVGDYRVAPGSEMVSWRVSFGDRPDGVFARHQLVRVMTLSDAYRAMSA